MQLFEIGKKVRLLRKDIGLTQQQLAQKAGISRVTLGKFERGEMAAISVKTFDVILSALGHEIDFSRKSSSNFGIPTLDELL